MPGRSSCLWRSRSGQSTKSSRGSVPRVPARWPAFGASPRRTAASACRLGRSAYQSSSWGTSAAPGPNTTGVAFDTRKLPEETGELTVAQPPEDGVIGRAACAALDLFPRQE